MALKKGDERMFFLCVLAGLAICFVISSLASADICASCTAPPFKDATDFLANNGYSPDQYAVLLTWNEAAHTDVTKILTGYHVGIKNTTSTFDLYSDSAGNILSPEDLIIWGVPPKNWDLPPIEQEERVPEAVAKVIPERPVPIGPSAKALNVPTVELPPVDLAALLAEDAAAAQTHEKAAVRVGIVRSLPEAITVSAQSASTGQWQTLADGTSVWSVTLNSPDAHALRIHFSQLTVPGGVRLIVFNTNNPTEAYGPYTTPPVGDNGLWTASCFSDTVTVECSVPPGTAATGLKVAIDTVTHTYADFNGLQWTKAFLAESCNNDVSCYSDWLQSSHAVAGYLFISYPSELHCTGSLIAAKGSDPTIPYFLTANHCVNFQSGTEGASSMEFFWLYQTSTCNGTPPSLQSVPHTTGGADLLATVSADVGSDFTLVRLRTTPPQGTTFLGWSTAPVSVGTEMVCIHHPSGDFKRISFSKSSNSGSAQNGGQPLQPYDYFIESLWFSGTTEGGSSGSPLMLADSHLVVGQLWGGYADCSTYSNGVNTEPDYFGRFDKSYPLMEQWLSPGPGAVDINQDGTVDSADVQLVVNAALGIAINPAYNADVDHSGMVDAIDVQLVILAVLNSGKG